MISMVNIESVERINNNPQGLASAAVCNIDRNLLNSRSNIQVTDNFCKWQNLLRVLLSMR